MPRIAIIGAGGYVFPLRLIGDLLSHRSLAGAEFALMDVDAARLARTAGAARELVAHHGLPARIVETTDRREALTGADYVIITFQVGGIDAYRHDVEIPRRHGVDQTVGDTLGPGGVFRFLRSVPAYDDIAADLRDVSPDALVLNYANPMAMATWYLGSLGVRTVGLCHSVQGTSRMLARELGVPYEEVRFRTAGVNHQAWFTEFTRAGADGTTEDLYPRLRAHMAAKHLGQRDAADIGELAADHGDHSGTDRGENVYEGGQERVRTTIMDAFGYFHTESSHHASEYLPYFRKDPETVLGYLPQRWDYYDVCAAHDEDEATADMLAKLKGELSSSLEYGATIIDSVETGRPSVIHGNVPNTGLVPNLPEGCCVEVACLVDGNGVQPTAHGPLPPQLAAVNQRSVAVQELAVAAALTRRPEHVLHAVLNDPLTSALLTIEQTRAMVDELRAAHAQYLPKELR